MRHMFQIQTFRHARDGHHLLAQGDEPRETDRYSESEDGETGTGRHWHPKGQRETETGGDKYHLRQNKCSYGPFVFDLICSRNDCNFPRRRLFGINENPSKKINSSPEIQL